MNKLIAQKIFDKVVRHLAHQKCRSMSQIKDFKGTCAYRGAKGRMCSIGVLIPDSKYNRKLEGNTVGGVVISDAFPEFKPYAKLLGSLQLIHDTEYKIVAHLQFCATKFNLSNSVVKEVESDLRKWKS